MEIWVLDPSTTSGIATTHAVDNWVKHLPAHRLPPPDSNQIHGLRAYCTSPKYFSDAYFSDSGDCNFWNSEIDVILSTSLRISDFDYFQPEFWRSYPIVHFMHCSVFNWKDFVMDRLGQVYHELGDFSLASRIVVSSEWHKKLILQEYKDFVSTRILDEIESKIDVQSYLIDYNTRLKKAYTHLEVPPGPTVLGLDKFEVDSTKPVVCYSKIPDSLKAGAKKEDIPIFIWSQRLSSDKNPGAFCKFLKNLDAQGVDFRLYITTGFSYSLKTYIKKYFSDLWHKVGYICVKPDDYIYSSILHSSDYWVSTAKVETFGISFMESMWCGVLPILPKALCYPEMIPNEYHDNFFYEDGNINELTTKAVNLIKNKKSIDKKFDRTFMRKYDVPAVRDSWLKCLDNAYNGFYSTGRMNKSKVVEKVVDLIKSNGRISKREIYEFLGWGKYDYWGFYRNQLRKNNFSLTTDGGDIYYTTPEYIDSLGQDITKEDVPADVSSIPQIQLTPRKRKFVLGSAGV